MMVRLTQTNGKPVNLNPEHVSGVREGEDHEYNVKNPDTGGWEKKRRPVCDVFLAGGQGVHVFGTLAEVQQALSGNAPAPRQTPKKDKGGAARDAAGGQAA